MLLATRCPFCETVFRLQPAQLALRRGLVRCGHCHEVFDASSSLFDVTEGGDFSTAKPVEAAAAIEALSGVRAKAPDFSAEAWDPWAPTPDAAVDNRLLHDTHNVPLSSVSTGAGVAVTPHHAHSHEPELPPSSFSTPVPPDDEPALADAPLEPFAYRAEPPAEDAPRVWHKTERASEPSLDEPVLPESTSLHGIPDNEPRFHSASFGAAAGATTAEAEAEADHSRTARSGASTAYPSTPEADEPTAFSGAAAAASGEPFSVNPVNDGVDPFPVVRETRPAEPRRLGWIIAGSVVAVLLVLALLAQLAWWQRETVLVYFPSTQTLYAKACAQLGCLVTPPHDIDGLQVEPSDLRQIDGPHKLELKMPLRNRFNVALAYPAIELTLLDDQNNVAVRRVLWPQDYVPPGTPIAAGLPARSTQTMIVHLDTGNAVASNFRVQIFYP
ncbi:zinc-ribbon and DUF3426 domain-containing protein [Paraburkholderia sp. BL21I4N1]|uniref:zinc-ribbon and DUF3426 domain-containing protein n=1 Tax=Paraburkholderia sp. BL21I4N1 TaxID=1938801 RepID=UPI000CFAFBE1|nr:zinc-ribbon and DUF3426 domain-containing protein [Paraburkholderia sp. BL21I4N1]PQV48725.1 putative Zn finger-like uncharacterized protein [Paraburkholderia sp. BL21I4N1]